MEQIERIVASLGYQVLSVKELSGGVSAVTTLAEVRSTDGARAKWAVRQSDHRGRATFKVLEELFSTGLPVPKPVCETTGYLITEYVEGSSDEAPDDETAVDELARMLARIHTTRLTFDVRKWISDEDVVVEEGGEMFLGDPPDEELSESVLRQCIEDYYALEHSRHKFLLHGDFWPGNVIWRDGSIAAVIDWEDAILGEPLMDLGNSRLEILWKYGPDGMRGFTNTYLECNPLDTTNLCFWDLMGALRPVGKIRNWGLPQEELKRMIELHQWFVDDALTRRSFTLEQKEQKWRAKYGGDHSNG